MFINTLTDEIVLKRDLENRLGKALEDNTTQDELTGTDYAVVIRSIPDIDDVTQVAVQDDYYVLPTGEYMEMWSYRDKTPEELENDAIMKAMKS